MTDSRVQHSCHLGFKVAWFVLRKCCGLENDITMQINFWHFLAWSLTFLALSFKINPDVMYFESPCIEKINPGRGQTYKTENAPLSENWYFASQDRATYFFSSSINNHMVPINDSFMA